MFDYYCYISVVSYVCKQKINSEYELENIHYINGEEVEQFLEERLHRPASCITDK